MLSKLLSLYLYVRYYNIPGPQRWFIRLGYLAKFYQYKFFLNDYLYKIPYKEICFKGEFQQELIRILPHAYWHFVNGTLKSTKSCKFTTPFYFFSPAHDEAFVERDYLDNESTNIPNSAHNVKIDQTKWLPPPLAEYYKNEFFVYEKPILIIANRFNTEWQEEPVSYFDLEFINILINKLKGKYQIIYNRPAAHHLANDNSIIQELNDISYIKFNHKEVLLMDELHEKYCMLNSEEVTYNQIQLMVYANCRKFISIHGGTAALASYFGGTNIIYSAYGHEHILGEFATFELLASAKVKVGRTYDSILHLLDEHYL